MKIVFVPRPKQGERGALLEALRATAKNGQAVQLRHNPASAYTRLRREDLILHTRTKKKGAR